MKRITVSLSDGLAWCLEREAKRRDVSASEVVRQALTERYGLSGEKRKVPFAGLFSGDGSNVSERVEEIIAEEWGDALPGHRGR